MWGNGRLQGGSENEIKGENAKESEQLGEAGVSPLSGGTGGWNVPDRTLWTNYDGHY